MNTVTIEPFADDAANAHDQFESGELQQFQDQGFSVVRSLAPVQIVERMRKIATEHTEQAIAPVELESELTYPGAPTDSGAPGGRTIRRLKQAYGRDPVFEEWVRFPPLIRRLEQLLGTNPVMPTAHHNCVMTKQPRHSSDTRWHQDIRYWSYEKPELVSVWLSLGREYPNNGGLFVVPGSHRMDFERSRFDESIFFRSDLPENRSVIEKSAAVELEPGDVLFFHCRTLHSASRNRTAATKYSTVFTFRAADNPPIPDSRSAQGEEVALR